MDGRRPWRARRYCAGFLTACVAVAVLGGGRVGAQPLNDNGRARYSPAPVNAGPPDVPLTVALVSAGGGPGGFDARRLFAGDGGDAPAELSALIKTFGSDNVDVFVKTFGFVINDALAQFAKDGTKLPSPSPDPADGKALFAALYAAGLTPSGKFDVEYMLDALVSHPVHVGVMNDVDANPDLGAAADATYHAVLARAIADLKPARAKRSK